MIDIEPDDLPWRFLVLTLEKDDLSPGLRALLEFERVRRLHRVWFLPWALSFGATCVWMVLDELALIEFRPLFLVLPVVSVVLGVGTSVRGLGLRKKWQTCVDLGLFEE